MSRRVCETPYVQRGSVRACENRADREKIEGCNVRGGDESGCRDEFTYRAISVGVLEPAGQRIRNAETLTR